MSRAVSRLLGVASKPIAEAVGRVHLPNRRSELEEELCEILSHRNGFYAFESALLVRPACYAGAPLGTLQWNEPMLWRRDYTSDLGDTLFFAEDVFGAQYCIRDDSVCNFDPETARFEIMCSSLEGWADTVMGATSLRTGFAMAHDWQIKNGPLLPGTRLLPKVPFVCGGPYDVDNLYAIDDVTGMQFRASIANQIRDLPDGSEIVFRPTDVRLRE